MKTLTSSASLGTNIVRLAALVAGLLLIPLVAMQFSNDVVWTTADFVIAGMLLFGTGLAYLLLDARLQSTRSRLIVGGLLAIALMLVWAELAVGVFGSPFAGN